MAKAIEVPFGYGDVIAVTASGNKTILWLKDANSIVRGLIVDLTDPANPVVSKDEIVVRRKTEGQVRRKKLPPVGNPLPAPAAAPARPAAAAPARPPAGPSSPAGR